MNKITIKGAREHNLKNIDLELPRDKFIVFTGISGSGKSTLAFDTIFAEGQRRYLESLSSYARQFLGQMEKPNVDHIEGLSPTISISQKAASHNPRSTVGTITEIYDYMRLFFAKIGVPYCVKCNKPISAMTIEQMVDNILDKFEGKKIKIFSPMIRGKKGEYLQLLNDIYKKGYHKAKIDGKIINLDEKIDLARYKIHNIDIFIDEIEVNENNLSRIFEDVEQAVNLSDGLISIIFRKEELIMNKNLSCFDCGLAFVDIEPRLFSFNSPYGACPNCNGLGNKMEIDAKLVIPDFNKTISEGGVLPWSYKPNNYYGSLLDSVAQQFRIPLNVRLKDISKEKLDIILYGGKEEEQLEVRYYTKKGSNVFHLKFNGLVNDLERRYFKTDSSSVRKEIEKYMSVSSCKTCFGSRLKKEALSVKVHGKNIGEISAMSINQSYEYFHNLKLSRREELTVGKIVIEIKNRLGFLVDVGLNYLTLDRTGMTLAGGEAQRIRLASQIGSALVGVLYVLDEPSIGLHARDNRKLLDTLKHLRKIGNTLIVIEHDEETMREADYLVDIGPGAGAHGGKIVFAGSYSGIMKCKDSITGQYLSGKKKIEVPKNKRKIGKNFLTVYKATENNLKNVDVSFPLRSFVCVTGVSGSGKSSLVNEILYKSLARKLHHSMQKPGAHQKIDGIENIDKIIQIDQSPIGRTPRSNPATYTGLFTPIREIFTLTKEAKARGYQLGRFSFNVAGGRCEVCKGEGFIKVEMQFLPDVYLPCEVCKGKRYNQESLKIKYKGKNIAQVLDMTVDEAEDFWKDIPQVYDVLKILKEVGLGYIHLGQAATTLSGGEAQRIKLASELSRKATGRTLYLLDEPTTGLHFDDVKKLLDILNRLVDSGNTVIIIEHNLDVIKSADYIIDLGPEGGEDGGRVVVTGTPEEVAKHKKSFTGIALKELFGK
ncbi:MAG: excinuclease ABC subunit UvrA [Candidatus Pacebacteria bacterium]|nr:excinuclease ABC subunit UvrA [Candidatus Paceibacterota bacterium]